MNDSILARARAIGLMTLLLLLGTTTADAQRYQQYSRGALDSPQVQARGGATAALPTIETGLFYNPAHLARTATRRAHVEILGVQGGMNTKLFDDLTFMFDRVIPAVEDGLDLPLSAEERQLFDDTLAQGRLPTVLNGGTALPRITTRISDVGVSAGFFGTTTVRYRFEDIGGGIPQLDLFNQNDVIFAVGAGALVPNTPVAAGLTARYVYRTLVVKNKDLLAMDPDSEVLPTLTGSTLAFDLGVHATDLVERLPGRLDAAIVLYDLVGGGMSYSLGSIALTGDGSVSADEADAVMAAYDGRDGSIGVRMGVAYHLDALGPLATPSVALDYLSTGTSESNQPLLARVYLGAEAGVAGPLRVRTGLSQGYPTLGFGLRTRPFTLDYAFFGVEDGRTPGQLPRYTHQLRLRFGLL